MSDPFRCCPAIQPLENRLLMAADGATEVGATPEEPARDETTVVVEAWTASGYSADHGGGGIWHDPDGPAKELKSTESPGETASITEITISGNTANNEGGGLGNADSIRVESEGQTKNPVDEFFAQHGRQTQAARDVLVLIGPDGTLIYTSA